VVYRGGVAVAVGGSVGETGLPAFFGLFAIFFTDIDVFGVEVATAGVEDGCAVWIGGIAIKSLVEAVDLYEEVAVSDVEGRGREVF
jgi:hypothetical protein